MNFSWARALIVARREYLTTVRRKAFLLTLVGMPLYFAFVMMMAVKPQMAERLSTLREMKRIGVADSSGLFAGASRNLSTTVAVDPLKDAGKTETFSTRVVFYPDQASLEGAVRSGEVAQAVVVPADYLQTGRLRRYVRTSGVFSSVTAQRAVERWLVQNLLAARVDSVRIERVARPAAAMDLFALNREGHFELKDDRRELLEFFVPMLFAVLLGVCIVTGGQYLLQGVSEEKESRILESLLCTLSAEDLLAGKLLGLGAAGLTLVGAWTLAGLTLGGPSMALARISLPPALLGIAVVYFLLGYLFYASLMTGIGAVTNNMREAQQFAFMFTFSNFLPFIMVSMILSKPDGPAAVALSLIPFTAATTMMMRMAAPDTAVPLWQVGLSIALLAGSAWLAVRGAARVFRIGLLMYGKTPTLPEILRWARAGR